MSADYWWEQRLADATFDARTDDDVQAHGDDLRDVITRDLIVKDPPPADWQPRPEDLA